MNARFLGSTGGGDVRARYAPALSAEAADALSAAVDARILAIDGSLPAAAAALLTEAGVVVASAGAATLVAVTRAALERARQRATGDELLLVATLLEALDRAAAPAPSLRMRDVVLDLRSEAQIMGIVNVTPNSFYERVEGVAEAVAKSRAMANAGAAIIDVGGQSYAAHNARVSASEERARVVPAVRAVAAAGTGAAISVDTFTATVADAALRAGAHLINDCSGLSDAALPAVVAKYDAGLVVMHIKGVLNVREPDRYVYDDVMSEIIEFLYERAERAIAGGVARDAIAIDPGLEFGKEPATDLEILDRFGELRALGYPIVFASSRKSFIGRVFDRPADALLVPSLATAAIGISAGARILRVHDVAETVQLARMMAAVAPERRTEIATRARAV